MGKVLKWIGGIVVGFILLCVIIGVLSGGGTTTTATTDKDKAGFIIKISGTDGLEYSGGYMLITLDGKSVSKSVDGVVPTEYPVNGSMVSVTFQKKGENGNLKVEILKGGQVVAESDTSAAYGVVSAATQ